MRTLTRLLACVAAGALIATTVSAEPLKLNDKGYLETRGVNVLVFSNWYDSLFSDSKISGVELVQQGVRTATNGDVRLMPTPGQWDEIGQLVDRQVDPATGAITATLKYPAYDFSYVIKAEPAGEGVRLSIILDTPLPEALKGRAGFNLEFLPSAYFHKSYLADGKPGGFPIYPSGPMKSLGPGVPMSELLPQTEPLPLATGKTLVLAPEDPARRVTLTSEDGELALYDGRNQAQNGWFVVRGPIPSGKTGAVLSWTLDAHSQADWVRPAMIAHSQLGYTPAQKKTAVIELDPNDTPGSEVTILQVGADGRFTPVLTAPAKAWGHYLRYDYLTADFSAVKTPGLYVIDYKGQRTSTFRIAEDVYSRAWEPTLDVYLPVAMDHMKVNEAYRVWHGDSHRDDAMQAPVNDSHVDLYASGPTTDTKYQPYEHIPGLNVGGWYDAGDFDIRTQTQYGVVRALVRSWEKFGLTRDNTLVDHPRRYVDIHVPDGKPDLLQQIQHGTIQLVAQYDAVGHAINGIVEPDVAQYTHLGDGVTKTDNLIYDRSLGRDEVTADGRSGMPDDRWAFTNRSSALNYGSIAALAASSRALKGFDDPLAAKSLEIAKRIWAEEHSHAPDLYRFGNTTGGPLLDEELAAAVELLIATGDTQYAARIEALWPEVEKHFSRNAQLIAQVIPFMPKAFKARVRPAVVAWKAESDKIAAANPFGVPITEGGWAGNGTVIDYAMNTATLAALYPDVVGTDAVYRALDYLHGTHPGSNVSFVSGVGTVSKEVAYGNNRADFSFIAGGVVPGVLIIKPDLPENKEDWPFFWGENEYVINVGADYIELVNTADRLKK